MKLIIWRVHSRASLVPQWYWDLVVDPAKHNRSVRPLLSNSLDSGADSTWSEALARGLRAMRRYGG